MVRGTTRLDTKIEKVELIKQNRKKERNSNNKNNNAYQTNTENPIRLQEEY